MLVARIERLPITEGARDLAVELLDAPQWQLRSAAARWMSALALTEAEAVALLRAAAADLVPWSRSAAQWTLRYSAKPHLDALATPPDEADPPFAAALTALISGEPDEATARNLASALMALDRPIHPQRLAPLLRHGAWPVRALAVEALGQGGDPLSGLEPALQAALTDPIPGVREAAASITGRIGPDAFPDRGALTDQLVALTEDEDGGVRQRALEAMSRWSPALPPALPQRLGSAALQDDHGRVRAQGAALLSLRPDPAAVDLLIDHLDDGSESVRLTVSDTLEQMAPHHEDIRGRLWRRLDDGRSTLRVEAMRLLETLHTDATVPLGPDALERLLYQPSGRLWQAAQWLLDRAPISSMETAAKLLKGARSDAAPIRARSLKALLSWQRALPEDQLSPTLSGALKDSARKVRGHAATLTGRLLADQGAAAEIGRGLWPQLTRRLMDGDPRVAQAAHSQYAAHARRLTPWLAGLKPGETVWPRLAGQLAAPRLDLHQQSRFIERAHGHIAWYGQLIQRRAAHRGLPDPFETLPPPSMPHDLRGAADECVRLAEIFAGLKSTAQVQLAARREAAWLLAQWIMLG